MEYLNRYTFKVATLLKGASSSDLINILGYQLVGLVPSSNMPAVDVGFAIDTDDGVPIMHPLWLAFPPPSTVTLVGGTGEPEPIVGVAVSVCFQAGGIDFPVGADTTVILMLRKL